MSQKSTARTGSEGDAEHKELRNISARSASSSQKSKRDIIGGPFGDAPFDCTQDAYQDYLLIMFHNKEDSPGTSESSQADHELYNVHYNYTDHLNMVRRRLNMTEFKEEDYEGCKITEISDELNMTQGSAAKEYDSLPRRQTTSAISKHKEYEVTTIHPFSLNYNLESGSSTNIFESDYSPPSKKVCQRLKTPRFGSVSEGNVPYHTKVGIHDAMFKATPAQKKDRNLRKCALEQFTETRETQCTEAEFPDGNAGQKEELELRTWKVEDKISALNLSCETYSECDSPKSVVLFPNIVIDTKSIRDEESSVSSNTAKMQSTSSSANKESSRKPGKANVLPLNSVRGSSDEEEEPTVSMTNTTIDTAGNKKRTKKNVIQKPKGPLQGLTMWEEISRLRSGTDNKRDVKAAAGDSGKSGDLNDFSKLNSYVGQLSQNIKLGEFLCKEPEKNTRGEGKSKLNQYIKQYIQYKSEVEKVRVASAKKSNKHTLIGQRFVNIENRIMDSPEKLYQSETSLVSDEERCTKSATGDSSDSRETRGFWERFCSCLCPRRNIDD